MCFSIFLSRFNSSVASRSRSFFLPKTLIMSRLLKLFYLNGYIFTYTIVNNSYIVYLNHRAISFKLDYISKPSNNVRYNFKVLKSFSNRGYLYVMETASGYCFSDTALISKISGKPRFRLRFFTR